MDNAHGNGRRPPERTGPPPTEKPKAVTPAEPEEPKSRPPGFVSKPGLGFSVDPGHGK